MTEPTSESSATKTSTGPETTRRRRKPTLHPTGLVVAVVGLMLSVTAYFVTSQNIDDREDTRLGDAADEATDQVGDLLRDVETLVSGVEGTLIATEAANREQLERLMQVQVERSDLITSATLLKAQQGQSLETFGSAGQSRYVDLDDLSELDLIEERIATMSAIPDGGIALIAREPVDGVPTAAIATSFTTRGAGGAGTGESWVVELELAFPPEVIDRATSTLPGDPVLVVYLGPTTDPDQLLLGPDRDISTDAERPLPILSASALVGIAPRSDLLGPTEQLFPLFVFLAGLALTALLTPLVGRLASRREEVRALSAQRDELDRALSVSQQIERELRASEQRFRSVLQSSPDVVMWIDPEHATIQILNRDDLFGHSTDAAGTLEGLLDLTHPDDIAGTTEGLDALRHAESGLIIQFEFRLRRPDDQWEWLRVRGGRVQRDDGTSGSILAVLTAITDQKREEARRAQLEAQLVQSQRLEAVGQLAGGVAHDFNNILAAIVSGAELVLDEVDGQTKDDVEEIRRTARRGSDLARQLLLFSRRDRGSSPEVVDVNSVVNEVETMLRRTLDSSIELHTDLTADPHKVHIDPSQIERILMNLTINARDALPEGGTITIRTENFDADEDDASTRPGLTPGEYLRLTVSDTGTGMPEDVRRHAFEPFFSTKEVGKGTGLGLATVYGIVQGVQGHVEIDSEPGEGTTFTILLPRTRLGPSTPAAPTPDIEIVGGHESILLVEDEPAVREAARRLLERRGYHVIAAADGQGAIDLAEAVRARRNGDAPTPDASTAEGARDDAERPFDLLLSDVLMPGGMNGRQTARGVREVQPGIAVLYMTGHSDDVLDDVGIDDDEGESLIVRKPFTEEELLRAVRAALSRQPEHSS